MLKLNIRQADKLADFFFDVAKGVLLAGLGFSVVTPLALMGKLTFLLNSTVLAYVSIRFGLELLKEGK